MTRQLSVNTPKLCSCPENQNFTRTHHAARAHEALKQSGRLFYEVGSVKKTAQSGF